MAGELQPWFAGWPSLEQFRKEFDDLFARFFGDTYRTPAGWMSSWPMTESYVRDGRWIMRVDLPGVDPKDIDVSVAGETLTIRASRERRSQHDSGTHESSYRFEHSVTLPKGVDSDQIKASYQHGVLELSMPASPQVTGRRIPVELTAEDKPKIEHQAAA
jgi:HSP20 family protein